MINFSLKRVKIATVFFILAAIKYFRYLPVSMFEADQEYLALSGQAILSGDFTLIGAPTSVGGMFIGPLYNYLIAGLLWLFDGNPLVINGLSFFWGSLAIAIIYLVGNRFYLRGAGFLAALTALGSVNFLNHETVPPLLFPLPLITLFFIAGAMSKLPRTKKALLLGTLVGLALNLHFSGLFLIPFLVFFGWIWIIPLTILVSPLMLFELRNNFFITENAVQFLTRTVGEEKTVIFYRLNTFVNAVADLIGPLGNIQMVRWATILFLLWVVFKLRERWLTTFIILPLIFFLVYPDHLIPYYSIIAWPACFLALGMLAAKMWNNSAFWRLSIVVVGTGWLVTNFNSWLNWYSGRSIDKKLAALYIIKAESNDRSIYLSRTIEPGTGFGFDYLISHVGLESSGNINDPAYTLVVPDDWQNIKSDFRFGQIGVVLPLNEEKNEE